MSPRRTTPNRRRRPVAPTLREPAAISSADQPAGPRRQPPTHHCPCGGPDGLGCLERIPPNQFACRPGWRRLPAPYRRAINATYYKQPGGQAHRAAMLAAVGWYERNPATGADP